MMNSRSILITSASLTLACAAMAILTLLPMAAPATALAGARSTVSMDGDGFPATLGSSTVYYGSLVAAGEDGLIVPAANTAGLRVVGVAGLQYGTTLSVMRGIYRFENSGLTITNVGNLAWVVDDQTVGAKATNSVVAAGTVLQVESGGVWVDVGRIGTGSLEAAILGGVLSGLPTATNGLNKGQLWLSSGAIAVMP